MTFFTCARPKPHRKSKKAVLKTVVKSDLALPHLRFGSTAAQLHRPTPVAIFALYSPHRFAILTPRICTMHSTVTVQEPKTKLW